MDWHPTAFWNADRHELKEQGLRYGWVVTASRLQGFSKGF